MSEALIVDALEQLKPFLNDKKVLSEYTDMLDARKIQQPYLIRQIDWHYLRIFLTKS